MKRALGLALAAAVASGCGGGDDDGGDGVATTPTVGNHARFESPHIAFTFDYPEELVAERRPRAGVLARVAVERASFLNALKVRRTAQRELGPERYLDEFRSEFERTVDSVQTRQERIGELDTGVVEFEDSAEEGGRTVEFTSSSYFFAGGGETWQLECIADEEHRQQIEAACEIALRSVDFTG